MKKTYLAFGLIILILSSCGIYAGGPHDSLLFDGANSNSTFLNNAGKTCKVKVTQVSGIAIGTICRPKIYDACGVIDTEDVCETGQIFPDNTLLAGDKISTGPNGHLTIMLSDGKTIRFAENTSIMLNSNYCDNNFKTEVLLDEGVLFINAKPNKNVKGLSVTTENGSAIIEGTEFTYSKLKENGVNTDILRVYEGAVKFRMNLQNAENVKKNQSKGDAAKKLADDYQSGKITIEEFTKRGMELQNDVSEIFKFEVTVSAGYQSRISGTDNPTEPEAFDAGAYPWGED